MKVRHKYLNDIYPFDIVIVFQGVLDTFFSDLLIKHGNIINFFIYFLEFLLHKSQRVILGPTNRYST
jgi:hypothetical protein